MAMTNYERVGEAQDLLRARRHVATFSRFTLYKNSIPRGASSGRDVASE